MRASGDPLLFGIGGRLIERFGTARVEIIPALSSLQEAFARFKHSWDDARIVSLHGRRINHIPGLLLGHSKTFAFTDATHSPDNIARQIRQYLEQIGADDVCGSILFHVAENIGASDERVTSASLREIEAQQFSRLNVVCIIMPDKLSPPTFGLTEEEIVHSRGLITKSEVRAVTLHSLRLPNQGVFWDVGGGSGSISIEAAAMKPDLTVYTIEHREEEYANICENVRKFSLFNIVPVKGRASDVMASLPDPDAVFVGGSDGEMETIIHQAAERLPKGGRIVVNGVTAKTRTETPQIAKQHGLSVTSSTITVQRTGPGGEAGFNPITIMAGVK